MKYNNPIVVGVIVVLIAIFLIRGCLHQERRATVYAIGRNRSDCIENSVFVNDDGTYLSYKTKSGKLRFFEVEWGEGKPRLVESY